MEATVDGDVVYLRVSAGNHASDRPAGLLTEAELEPVRRGRTSPRRSCPAGRTTTRPSTTSSASAGSVATGSSSGGSRRVPFETQIDGERLVVVRDGDGVAAQRVGSRSIAVRTRGLAGVRVRLAGRRRTPLAEVMGDLVPHVERFDFAPLRRGHRVTYDVAANWKLIVENYSECYHCPGIHPQLNRLTPYDIGADYETQGAWQGGWMELREGFETMALGGAERVGPPMCGITPVDERRVDYLVVWPTTFLAVHPDYLLVHRLEPIAPDRTRIVCDWLFEPATMARRRVRPRQGDRVLGHDQPPGLARLRAPADRDGVGRLPGRPVREQRAVGPRLRRGCAPTATWATRSSQGGRSATTTGRRRRASPEDGSGCRGCTNVTRGMPLRSDSCVGCKESTEIGSGTRESGSSGG